MIDFWNLNCSVNPTLWNNEDCHSQQHLILLSDSCVDAIYRIFYISLCLVSVQKEENGKVVSVLPASQNKFFQSGLGPGQEYEVSINIIKNNTRGPQTTTTVSTSELETDLFSQQANTLEFTGGETRDVQKHPVGRKVSSCHHDDEVWVDDGMIFSFPCSGWQPWSGLIE